MKEIGVRSVDDAVKIFGCTTQCGLCKPYIEKMIETGETCFDVIRARELTSADR